MNCRPNVKAFLMKRVQILPAVIMLSAVVLLASCRSSRDYRDYPPPPPRTSVSLIIDAGPNIVVNRYRDGRYFYRAPGGYMYWRGYGNRYYLDRRYVNRSYHGHNQYRYWKRYYR